MGQQGAHKNAKNARRGGLTARLEAFLTPAADDAVDPLGIPYRVHYLLVSAIAFFVGFVPLLFALTPGGAALRDPIVVAICLCGVLVLPAYLALASWLRYERRENWLLGLMVFAVAGPLVCQLAMDDLQPAFLTLFILGPVGAAYYVPFRRALPVILFGTGSLIFSAARESEPNALARGVLLGLMTLISSLMIAAIKRHLIATVEANRTLAERDPLTGAYNMHKFDARLAIEIARSRRGGDGFALIVFDLDHFAAVNEQHGRAAGDDVLIASAEAIESAIAPTDLLVWRGADQFIVIAPAIPGRNLAATALLARDRIAAARKRRFPDLAATACAGWAVHDHEEDGEALLQRALDALEDAKRAHALGASSKLGLAELAVRSAPTAAEAKARVFELRSRRGERAIAPIDPMEGAMRIAWDAAGAMIVLGSLLFAILALTHAVTFGIDTFVFSQIVLWGCVLAPFGLWLTRRRHRVYLDHVLCVSALVLATVSCAFASGLPAATEMFVVACMFYAILLPLRAALAYAAVALSLYAYFLATSDYRHTDMRIATTTINILFVGAILALTRDRAIHATNEKTALAHTDALTGLANMRRLHSWLDEEIDRCKATNAKLVLMALDLDHFKQVNGLHGNAFGDAVLAATARALRETARAADLPARRGGDEFFLAMADAGARDAEETAEHVALAIKRARMRVIADVPAGVSIGWVTWRRGDSADRLLARAETELRATKAQARHARRMRQLGLAH